MTMFINKRSKELIGKISYIKFLALFFFLLTSILYSKNKIQFSAKTLETIIDDNQEKQIFKDDVVIKKNNLLLFTDRAIYYPDKNQVTLINNVKMYDETDSLSCDSLILYDTVNTRFQAINNVNFF